MDGFGNGFEYGVGEACDGQAAAVDAYQRVVRDIADNQVIDAAEAVLADAWLERLGEMRRCALELADATRNIHHEAMSRLRDAQSSSNPAAIADAHEFVEKAECDLDGDLAASRRLLASVEEHIEIVCRAGYERIQRKQADLERLRAAWHAAYGDACC